MEVFDCRNCENRKLTYKPGDEGLDGRQPYCPYGCSSQTKCGDTIVPEHHLQVTIPIY